MTASGYRVRRAIYRVESRQELRLRLGLIAAAALLASVLVESGLGAVPGLFRFRPDLLLISAVWWTVNSRGSGWAAIALAAGLLRDVFSAGPFGPGMVEMVATCWVIFMVSRPLVRHRPLVEIVLAAFAAVLSQIVYYLLLEVFSHPPAFAAAWRTAIFPHFWQTAAAAPVWLWATGRMYSVFSGERRR
ncbi:MAG TPA: rod shape-determining protein MreD [bacterium]|nr:rod shape-determining protein MreD [bacterium]HPQ66238.1 rod shape-determining protein MreD [bacterium]